MATHRQVRIGLICALIVQAFFSLTPPPVASASVHESAPPRALEPPPVEHLRPGALLQPADFPLLAPGAGVPQVDSAATDPSLRARPAAPTTLEVDIVSSPWATLDNTNVTAGPQVFVVEAVITNTGSTTPAEGVNVNLDYDHPTSTDWRLLSGEDPERTIDELAPGAAYHAYWFAHYPLSYEATHQYTVTVSATNAASVSTFDNYYGNPEPGQTVKTRSTLSTGSAGVSQVSADVVVGVAFTVTVRYDLGRNPREAIFSPVGNVDFNSSAYRLLASEVRFYDDAGTEESTVTDRLYFDTVPNFAENAEVTFLFIALTPSDTRLCSYTTVGYNSNVKYDQFYCDPTHGTTVFITGTVSLSLTKQASSPTVQQDQLLTYALHYANDGDLPLTYVWIWDDVDTAMGSIVTPTISPPSDPDETTSSRVAWYLGDVQVGETGTRSFTLLVDGGGQDLADGVPLVNHAFGGINSGSLPQHAALTSTITTTVQAPTVALSKTDGRETAEPGDALTYAVRISNPGSVAATGLVLTDVLPFDVNYVSGTAKPAETSRAGQTLVWTGLGSIPPGGTAAITIPVTVAPKVPNGTILSNTATMQYENPAGHVFPSLAATDTTTVNAPVLSISKSDRPDPVLAGRLITYTLHCANSGPAPAANVRISDTVPLSTTYHTCTGGSTCGVSNGVVSWMIDTIPGNTQATVGFSVWVSDTLETGTVIRNEEYGLIADQTEFTAGPPVTTLVSREAAFIQGHTFVDADGDGKRDAGELALPGVTVTLTQATVPTITTGGTGYYRFRVESAGAISVTADLPAGYFRTTRGTVLLESTLQTTQTVDFGYALNASTFGVIYGTVFEDVNHDGVQSGGEPGIGGVDVNSGEAVPHSVTTNELGQYTLRYNTGGPVSITEADPPGHVSTTPNEVQASAVVGSSGPSPIDFGDFQGIRVTGQVFDDRNVNGVNDDGAFVAGATVVAGESFTTGSTGVYTLYVTVSDSDPITITETDPAGYLSTNAVAGGGMSRVDAHTLRIDSPASGTGYSGGDFGDVQASSAITISGQVWNDDGAGGGGLANGLRDGTESGLAGAVVRLSSGLSQTTALDGLFLLYGPPGQAVTVTETNPTGYVSTDAIPGTAAMRVDQDTLVVSPLVGGSTSAGNLFGDVLASNVAVISGTVFDDADEDGIFGGSESGLPGVLVTLETSDGDTVDTRTNAAGEYQFAVPPGTDVRITSAGPGGSFYPTTLPSIVLSLPTTGVFPDINFGYSDDSDRAVILGIVFDDANSNGEQDLGETGLAGAVVILDGKPPVTTDGDGLITGTFRFLVTLKGLYTIHETNPPGYRSTTLDDLSVEVALGNSYYVSFGDTDNLDTASIYGLAFDDRDGDGRQDPAEPGLPGVVISVTVGGDVLTTTTQSYGQYNYAFETETAGWHTVSEQDPALPGYRSTTPDKVNIDVELGHSYVVNFGDTTSDGFSTIMGTVFDDDSGEGVQDPSEPGIAGVLVSLSSGLTTTTDLYGNYTFSVTVPGYVQVIETDRTGYHSTTPNKITVGVGELGQVYVVDFGDSDNLFVSSILGTVFEDRNGNGARDPTESPLSGVTVNLNGSTKLTSKWGWYTFLIEDTGTYTVTETDPPGYFSTTPNTVTLSAELGRSYEVDFGDALTTSGFAAIFGTVFNDANSDGKWDPGELGIPGVSVTLDEVAATATDVYGRYTLSTTVAGRHTVRETDPPGSFSTTPNEVPLVGVALGHSYRVDFGDFLEACTCPPDSYEGDDSAGQARSIGVGAVHRQTHDFCDDDADWVKFSAQAGQVYTVTTSSWGQRADTMITLFGTDGRTRLATNDDYAGTTDYSSRFVWQAGSDGVYFVRTTNQGRLIGCQTDYEIWIEHLARHDVYLPILVRELVVGAESVSRVAGRTPATGPAGVLAPMGVITHTCPDAYEVDDTWQQAGRIEPGVVQVHSFDSDPVSYAIDKDFVWVDLRAQHTITFTVPLITNTLTLMELYDADGAGLDVTGTTRLIWTAAKAGRYYLGVSSQMDIYGCADEAGYHLLAETPAAGVIYLPLVARNLAP
jgi:uncharacterized repeat protein (TIGR01451 family)